MAQIEYREATLSDVPVMARLRSLEWETEAYWVTRVHRYITGESSPQEALQPRVAYVALSEGAVVGFITGHLTTRYGCAGELQWINVSPEWRGKGVSTGLLRQLAGWFVSHQAFRICTDVAVDNAVARAFYRRTGAEDLNEHWLYWRDIRRVVMPA